MNAIMRAVPFLALLWALPAVAADDPSRCPGMANVVEAAKMPEVDLYKNGDREPELVKSVPNTEFPACQPILGDTGTMLKMTIGADTYWVPRNMVYFRAQVESQAATKDKCFKVANAAGESSGDDQVVTAGSRGIADTSKKHCH
jgi:hypothetical protein